MSRLRIIPKEDWKIIRKYIFSSELPSCIVVFIPEEKLEEIGIEGSAEELDDTYIDYDCGGKPDLWIDVVLSKDHLFASNVNEGILELGE